VITPSKRDAALCFDDMINLLKTTNKNADFPIALRSRGGRSIVCDHFGFHEYNCDRMAMFQFAIAYCGVGVDPARRI
jgi:hypothetical protein